MTDDEILRDHIRVRTTRTRIFIEVRQDEQGETPCSRWTAATTLPLHATRVQVERSRMMTLADYRHFRVCDTCGDKFPTAMVRIVGDGTDICEGCDE
jgi:hypothetical protein